MKISLKNFQIYERQEFDFTGINLVVGRTNSGKSSLVRALESLLFTRISESGVRTGTNHCNVSLEDPSIGSISSSRDGDDVVYIINGKDYKKLGKKGHKELLSPLGIKTLNTTAGEFNLNISGQFDTLFFSRNLPSERFAIVSSLLNESKFTECVKDLATCVRDNNKSVTFESGKIDQLNSDIAQSKRNSDKVMVLKNKLDRALEGSRERSLRLQGLSEIRDRVKEAKQQIADGDKALRSMPVFELDVTPRDRILGLAAMYSERQEVEDEASVLSSKLDEQNRILDITNEVDYLGAVKLQDLNRNRQEIDLVSSQILGQKIEESVSLGLRNTCIDEIQKAVESMSNCPFCDEVVKDKSKLVERVMSHGN